MTKNMTEKKLYDAMLALVNWSTRGLGTGEKGINLGFIDQADQ